MKTISRANRLLQNDLALALAALFLSVGPSFAQNLDDTPLRNHLEDHLLRWPVFASPFDEYLSRWIDASEWQHLETHLEEKGKDSVRHRILRGMLFERRGDFEDAAILYDEAAKEDDWGRYHRARLLAFTGEIETAKEGLEALARTSDEVYLFREAALGIAELTLLREGVEAAEAFYRKLWETRTEFPMRLALVEPILSVLTETGKATAWLESLNPNVPSDVVEIAEEAKETALLWLHGDSLTMVYRSIPSENPRRQDSTDGLIRSHLPFAPPPTRSMRAPAWSQSLFRDGTHLDRCLHFLAEGLPSIDRNNPKLLMALGALDQPTDVAIRIGLSYASTAEAAPPRNGVGGGGIEGFLKTLAAVKRNLRKTPSVATSVFPLIKTKEDAERIHDFLANEVFEGIEDPSWRLISLLLRVQAGETPENLREEAVRLWRDVAKEDFRLLYDDCPDGKGLQFFRSRQQTWLSFPEGGDRRDLGCGRPANSVTWNLKGEPFVEAMRIRFRFSLEVELYGRDGDRTLWSSTPVTDFAPSSSVQSQIQSLATPETGVHFLERLWKIRDAIGLGTESLGDPGHGGEGVAARSLDAMARGSTKEVCAFVMGEQELERLPLPLLNLLRRSVSLYRAEPDTADTEDEGVKLAEAAISRLAEIFCNRHPGWLLTRFLDESPDKDLPELTPSQRRELTANEQGISRLLTHRIRSMELRSRMQEGVSAIAQSFDPVTAEVGSSHVARAEAERSLAAEVFPHPLWGLEWKPSIFRRTSVISDYYDLPATTPSFLEGELPEMLRSQNHWFFEKGAPFRIRAKIAAAFGPEAFKPDRNREPELRKLAGSHPFVRDLLLIWDELRPLPDETLSSSQDLSPRRLAAILEALKQADSVLARSTLACLFLRYGNAAEGRALAETFAGADGPEKVLPSRFAEAYAALPTPKDSPASPPASEEIVIRRAKAEIEHGSKFEPPQRFLDRTARSEEERKIVYAWLKKEIKEEPAFARHAALLAELARALGVSEEELAEAEALDSRLNAEGTDYWLRRHEELAKEAVDAVLEALRRLDFSARESRSPWSERTTALNSVVEARRVAELVSACETAIRGSRKDAAGLIAARILDAVLVAALDDSRLPEREKRVEDLLQTVHSQQPHLLLAIYDRLNAHALERERRGEKALATTLARWALRGVWPHDESVHKEGFHNRPTGVHRAWEAWGSEDEVAEKGEILPLFDLALRGEDAANFVETLVAEARTTPEDEHLVSCAILSLAKTRPLVEGDLGLLARLEPERAMRAAWRLSVHAPANHISASALVPFFEGGLAAIFQSERYLGSGTRHFLLAEKITPFIEQGGGREAIGRLLPRFVEVAAKLDSRYWLHLVELASRFEKRDAFVAIEGKWRVECEETLAGNFRTDWTLKTINGLLDAAEAAGADGAPFATLAYTVWKRHSDHYAAFDDLPPEFALRVGDALLAFGEREALSEMADSVALLADLGKSADMKRVGDGLRRRLGLLAEESPTLPFPLLHSTPGVGVGSLSIHWKFAPEARETAASHGIAIDPFSGRATAQESESKPSSDIPLHSLAGRYDLKILAGDTPENLKVVATLPGVAAVGSSVLPLPQTWGWMRAILLDPNARAKSLGEASPFASMPPDWDLAKTSDLAQIAPLGTIAGLPLAASSEDRILLSLATPQGQGFTTHDLDGLASLGIAALDEGGNPVAQRNLRDFGHRFSSSGALLLPIRELFEDNRLERHRGEAPASAGAIRSLALVALRSDSDPLPPLKVWVLRAESQNGGASREIPLLDGEKVAEIGFDNQCWHLSSRFPRAAFTKEGEMVAFDTSKLPWRTITRIESKEIRSGDFPFIVDEDTLQLVQWTGERGGRAGQRTVALNDKAPKELGECPRTDYPFDFLVEDHLKSGGTAFAEFSPSEDFGVFLHSQGYRSLSIAVVQAQGPTLFLALDQPRSPSNGPKVAWWGKGGQFTIHEKGLLHHMEIREDKIAVVKIEPGSLSLDSVPEGATPGMSIAYRTWSLKGSDLLLRRNKRTGAPLEGFRLKVPCAGYPIWVSEESNHVFLKTTNFDLIQVETPPAPPAADPVLVAAHRGGYADDKTDGAPENSVANVAVAVRKGFDLYETDIQINFEKGEGLSPEKTEAIRAAVALGILVETHSYGDPEEWRSLAEAGVRLFHTAVPDETLGWLRENGWRRE